MDNIIFKFTSVACFRFQKLIHEIPQDKLLPESDGPFVRLQGKPASPLDMPIILGKISLIKAIDVKMLKELIFKNFKTIHSK